MSKLPAVGSTGWGPVLDAAIQQSATFNVVDYGALADGTTDNASFINAAITAANAVGGGTVLVPAAASPFATGSTITLKANVTLCVMGTIKALASHTGVGITASDVSNVEVCGNGTLDMNKAATTNGGNVNTQQGILIGTGSATAVTNVRVRDLTVTNCWHYGVMTSAQIASSSISDVLIDNVTVTNAGQDAIINVGLGNTSTPTSPPPATSSGYVITRCVVTNPSVNGIHCVGVSDVHVGANLLTATASTGHGICMGSGGASTVDHTTDFTVTENKVRGFTGSSCFGILASARSTRFDISGNKIRGCWGAISTDVVDPNNTSATILVDGTVANNSCIGSTGFHGIYSQGLTGLTITGNVCRGNAQSGILLALAVSVSVTGNDSINNTGTGIALTGTTGGIGGHTVTGNTTTGNGGGAYYNECPVVSTLDAAAVPPSTLTTQQSLANSTAETTQFTYAIPPNLVQAGTTYRITLGYVIDNVATSGILTLRLYGWSGGTLLSTLVLPSQAGAATNQPLYLDYLLTVRNISASTGRVMVMGNVRSEFSALSKAFGGIVSTTINTSAVASLLMTAQWGTASASNVCRLELAAVEVVKS